jgi:hypothetical protein
MKAARWVSLLLGLAPLWLHGQETRSATIVAVAGATTVSSPSGSAGATVGSEVSVGSTIATTPGASVTLKFFDGTVGIVEQKTTVILAALSTGPDSTGAVKEDTLLDLKEGEVVAILDPSKKDVTHFSVRTPQGVATAHGTVFAVEVSQDASNSNVTTMSGTVTYVTSEGTFTIPFGQAATGGALADLAAAAKANPALVQDILAAASSVAAAIGNGSVTNSAGSPNLVNTVLSAVVAAAVEVAPQSAPQIVHDTIVAAGPALNGSANSGAVVAIASAAAEASAKVDPAGGTAATDAINASAIQAAQQENVPVDNDALAVATKAAAAPPPAKPNPILPPLDQTPLTVVSPSQKQ